ncbi:hypothetical protein FSP39_004564 [Pinctada imbricata]|uniref:C1q domain-containing protein n=1 Tax=Pinctada imbricata TaxID=66713 RepID=A0AA88YP08_PINIB|nr:hypothetical protein FSP39_004564 [Pinctada imbricata]
MTASFTTKGPGTKFIFDTVRTNVHNAYDKTTGVYTAPESGMYVFNWVIREHKSQHSVELMLNSEILGVTFKRAEGNDDASVSGTVVVSVRKGDSVFLRANHKADYKHKIHNNIHGRSSFSGWRLCG